ncbi:MAG: FRG domain-containing protein [Agrobacterium tumefaciens]|nr:FRG domain-containing protein [Agrobacterium tumefaciens]
MKGQWQGAFDGYSTGEVTIEIDDLGDHFSGRACVFQRAIGQLVFVAEFDTVDKKFDQYFHLPLQIQQVADTSPVSRNDVVKNFPNIVFPDNVKLTLKLIGSGLKVNAITSFGTEEVGTLTAVLTKGSADKKSKLVPDKKVKSWEKFKSMVGNLPPNRYIFRGQSVLNRLRTSFHRTNRRNLHKLQSFDIPQMHGALTSQTRHYFDLRDNLQNAAFWNLLQHHGYPTPLLDWTHSPYVAAYFAFREKSLSEDLEKRKVRVFMFDRAEWQRDYNQLYALSNVQPHFSLLNPIALENPRALPQQAICSITTVDDVESYLDKKGAAKSKTYLKAFDLSYTERTTVLEDLRLMGVTAGALFPGIDGACEEMRLRNFAT